MATSKLSRIGEILIKKQFCTPEQIRNALGVQRELQTKKLGTILVELTYVTHYSEKRDAFGTHLPIFDCFFKTKYDQYYLITS